jgi:hypothetical protein
MDGNWAALFSASDGKVYAGLAYHGGDGHMVYYDSKTDRMHDIGNLTELTGESHLKRGPQSKIHAKFGEGKDGRIYFGTIYPSGLCRVPEQVCAFDQCFRARSCKAFGNSPDIVLSQSAG